jgi:hypothetical protein
MNSRNRPIDYETTFDMKPKGLSNNMMSLILVLAIFALIAMAIVVYMFKDHNETWVRGLVWSLLALSIIGVLVSGWFWSKNDNI